MDYYVISAVKAALLMGFLLLTLLYLQWIERKVIAHVQVRIGPHRVGPHGLLQPVADSLKLLLKEDLIPPHVNKFLYLLAPFIAVTLALVSYAVIPFGPEVEIFGVRTRLQLADLDIAVLFVLAVSSMTVYAIVLAGWASNSKYPLLGALRSAAQMISYELPLALAVAAPLLLANTLNLREIVERQEGYYLGFLPRWNIFQLPAPQLLGFVVFVVAMFAETNRVPFDLPEAENELVAGFHAEYSAMKFAAFFMAEYANMITVSAMATLLFLGGWLPPWPARLGSDWVPTVLFLGAGALTLYHGLNAVRARDRRTLPVVAAGFFGLALVFAVPSLHPVIVPPFWFLAKVGLLLWIFMWVRGTLPRFRYDQLMRFAWGTLFPLGVVNLVATGLLVAVFGSV
jgi:NADH-quinone oxidoreductase subunit H